MEGYGDQRKEEGHHSTDGYAQNPPHHTTIGQETGIHSSPAGHQDIDGTRTVINSATGEGHDIGGIGNTNIGTGADHGSYEEGTHGSGGSDGSVHSDRGVVDKIEEKLPVGHHGNEGHRRTSAIDGGGGGYGDGAGHGYEEGKHGTSADVHRSDQGVAEKIKEKLPGSQHRSEDHHKSPSTVGGGGGYRDGVGQDYEEGNHGIGAGAHRSDEGVKEKLKEKLPGGHHGSEDHHKTPATIGEGGGYGAGADRGYEEGKHGIGAGVHRSDEGVEEKMKEKLPGGHHGSEDHHKTPATVGGGGGYRDGDGQDYEEGNHGTGAGVHRSDEGVMEKMKEKLPGGHHGSEDHHKTPATVDGGGGYGDGDGHGYEEGKHGTSIGVHRSDQGVAEKMIKEKLPGGHHTSEDHHKTSATVGDGGGVGRGYVEGNHGIGAGVHRSDEGVVEKMKERLPGGHHGSEDHHKTPATVGGGGYGDGHGHGHGYEEGKHGTGAGDGVVHRSDEGVVEKEKLPGVHHVNEDQHKTSATTGGGGGYGAGAGAGHDYEEGKHGSGADEHKSSATVGGGGGYGAEGHEKKGLIQKIKEKLPGGHHAGRPCRPPMLVE